MAKVGRCFAVRRIFGSISVAIDTGVTNLPLNVDGYLLQVETRIGFIAVLAEFPIK